MSNSHYDFYKKYIDALEVKAKEAVKEAQKKAFAEYFEVADKKIRKIYNDTIKDFYKSYTPTFYKPRRGSLYNLIKIKRTDEYLDIDFNPSMISYRNGYAESANSDGVDGGLYDLVFRHGWHGGANVKGKGRMLVPWSYPRMAYNGDVSPWEPSIWGSEEILSGWRLAEKSPISPLDDFRKRIDEYHETEYQRDYNEIWNKYKQNIKI